MGLEVYRDMKGHLGKVGAFDDAKGADGRTTFCYAEAFLSSPGATALSFSLPLRTQVFSEEEFKPYFKRLLPEGAALNSLDAALTAS